MTRFAPLPLLTALLLTVCPAIAQSDVAGHCSRTAGEYIDSLDADARSLGVQAFDSKTRRIWTYRPGAQLRKDGLYLGGMSATQRFLAHRLIDCGLSAQGYLKAVAIMRLDDLVAAGIDDIAFKSSEPIEIGSPWYWLTVFGDPGNGQPWGWQVEGHHLGLNFTVVDGELSAVPAFYGADPAEVKEGARAGERLLSEERDRAFALLASLDSEQRGRAILQAEVPRGIFTVPGKGDILDQFAGLPAGAMSAAQRQRLWLLMDAYLKNVDAEVADKLVAKILRDGTDQLYFAWMGATTPGSPIYYRIHGPSILIEFDHSANIRSKQLEPDPNHVHSIMRVPGNDFGADLLRQHYAESLHHQQRRSSAKR
jgi:hypothetical protein